MRPILVTALLLLGSCSLSACGQDTDIDQSFAVSDLNKCGPYALQACANTIGIPIRQSDIEQYLVTDGRETSFGELSRVAEELGLATVAIRWTDQPDLALPAILPIRINGRPHFIAAVAIQDERIIVIDIPHKALIRSSVLRNKYGWKGQALHIGTTKLSIGWLYFKIKWMRFVLGACILCVCILILRRWLRRYRKAVLIQVHAFWALWLFSAVGCGIPDSELRIARIDPETISVGPSDVSKSDGEIETAISIINSGSSDLTITRVIADCGCTSIIPPPSKYVRPGDVAKAGLRIRPPSRGLQIVRVWVDVESASRRERLNATIKVAGEPIHPPEMVSCPTEIRLKRGPDGVIAGKLRIRTFEHDDTAPWISEIVAEGPIVTAAGSRQLQERGRPMPGVVTREYIFPFSAINTPAAAKQSMPAGHITVYSSKKSKLRHIPVTIDSWTPIYLSPATLFVNLSDNQQAPQRRDVRVLISESNFHPETLNAVADVNWIDVGTSSFSESNATREATITVTLDPSRLPAGNATIRGGVDVDVTDDRNHAASDRLEVVVKR